MKFLIGLGDLRWTASTEKNDMYNLITPEPFSQDIMEKAGKMRASIPVPACLDSPYFFARFLRVTGGDEKMARTKVEDYLSHRELLGYASCSDLDIFTKFPIAKATLERFCLSAIDPSVLSGDVHVTVMKMEGCDLKEIMKVIPLSHVLHTYYMIQDVFCRVLAQNERITGRPASVVSIVDLKGVRMSDFLNPFSTSIQLSRLVTKIWSEYFRDNVCKMVLINPPTIMSLMFRIAKFIMDAETFSHLIFLNDVSDLHKYLQPQAIPVAYGGTWRDDRGFSNPPEGCTRPLRPVTSEEYRKADDVWSDYGITKPPPSKTFSLKSQSTCEIARTCKQAGRLIWNFTIHGDVEFEIVRKDAREEVKVWPKITLTSLKLPEHGSVTVIPGVYVVRFKNPSTTWLPVKVTGTAEIKTEDN